MAKYAELSASQMEHLWRTKWFAKGDLTARVDREIRQHYGMLLDKIAMDEHDETCHDRPLWEKMALIVLFDQVSRNAKRGTPMAYAFDDKALKIATSLIKSSFQELPFQFQGTLCICLCHAEIAELHILLKSCLSKMDGKGNKKEIHCALVRIAKKHEERIHLFGRFPERNKALNRISTKAEVAFLDQLR